MNYTPLVPRVTPNDLRRTFGSLLVQGGTPLADVARMMGHKGTEMVFKVYGKDTPESLAARVALPVMCTLQTRVPNRAVRDGKGGHPGRGPGRKLRCFWVPTHGFEP